MRTERILYIRTDRMGDVLMNLPAIRRIRQNHPKAWLTWMVDRSVAPLLRRHPDVDELLEVDALQLKQDRKWGFLLSRRLKDDKDRASRHETQSNLRLAGLLGEKPWDGSWALPLDEDSSRSIEKRLSEEFGVGGSPLVAIHPGTSDEAKRWPLENFQVLCKRLLDQGRARIVLVGGSEEEPISRKLMAALGEGACDWTGALGLAELSALLHSPRVKTLVSVDSGPVHVAWLHHKPVVALYAKNKTGSDPARWGALSAGSVCLYKDIRKISPEEVFRAVEGILTP